MFLLYYFVVFYLLLNSDHLKVIFLYCYFVVFSFTA